MTKKPLKSGLINVEEDTVQEPEPKKKPSNRKTITLQKEEFDLWKKMKGIYSWTSLLRVVRTKADQLDRLLSQQIIIGTSHQLPQIPQRGQGILPTRKNTHNMNSNHIAVGQKRPEYHAEYKKLVEKDELNNFLKPMSEEELAQTQKSEDELEKSMIKSAKIAIMRFKRDVVEIEQLNPPPL